LLGHLDDVNPKMVSGVDHVKLATVNETPLSRWRYSRIRRHSQCSAVKALLLARALGAIAQVHREAVDRQKYLPLHPGVAGMRSCLAEGHAMLGAQMIAVAQAILHSIATRL
jgi:hypothetical protein